MKTFISSPAVDAELGPNVNNCNWHLNTVTGHAASGFGVQRFLIGNGSLERDTGADDAGQRRAS